MAPPPALTIRPPPLPVDAERPAKFYTLSPSTTLVPLRGPADKGIFAEGSAFTARRGILHTPSWSRRVIYLKPRKDSLPVHGESDPLHVLAARDSWKGLSLPEGVDPQYFALPFAGHPLPSKNGSGPRNIQIFEDTDAVDVTMLSISERLSENNRNTLFAAFSEQLLEGLSQLHAAGYGHNDLSPDNLYVNQSTLRLQIGDLKDMEKTHEAIAHDYTCLPNVLSALYFQTKASLPSIEGYLLSLFAGPFSSIRDYITLYNAVMDPEANGEDSEAFSAMFKVTTPFRFAIFLEFLLGSRTPSVATTLSLSSSAASPASFEDDSALSARVPLFRQ